MTSEAQQTSVSPTFGISRFFIENFELDEFAKSMGDLDQNLLLFHHEGSAKVEVESGHILIRLQVRCEYEGKRLAQIATTTDFRIVNFEIFQSEGTIQIPPDFWVILVGLSYSTTRGALIAKGEGTQLAKYPMPVVNPSTLIQKDS